MEKGRKTAVPQNPDRQGRVRGQETEFEGPAGKQARTKTMVEEERDGSASRQGETRARSRLVFEPLGGERKGGEMCLTSLDPSDLEPIGDSSDSTYEDMPLLYERSISTLSTEGSDDVLLLEKEPLESLLGQLDSEICSASLDPWGLALDSNSSDSTYGDTPPLVARGSISSLSMESFNDGSLLDSEEEISNNRCRT